MSTIQWCWLEAAPSRIEFASQELAADYPKLSRRQGMASKAQRGGHSSNRLRVCQQQQPLISPLIAPEAVSAAGDSTRALTRATIAPAAGVSCDLQCHQCGIGAAQCFFGCHNWKDSQAPNHHQLVSSCAAVTRFFSRVRFPHPGRRAGSNVRLSWPSFALSSSSLSLKAPVPKSSSTNACFVSFCSCSSPSRPEAAVVKLERPTSRLKTKPRPARAFVSYPPCLLSSPSLASLASVVLPTCLRVGPPSALFHQCLSPTAHLPARRPSVLTLPGHPSIDPLNEHLRAASHIGLSASSSQHTL
ncbi:hypothetical protein B0H67DRAFT_37051 [Lasiosphaeris hirsuta]|uniref:Uncharacterized protein n=1 Tax=Lasiosphaeris hirsuta TaxID=260670 RepID=A0AA40EAV9_9PEZI|nr:hypothetical protein B0H67DRAFT_37051 [Lasiosphaeris hirsuta]